MPKPMNPGVRAGGEPAVEPVEERSCRINEEPKGLVKPRGLQGSECPASEIPKKVADRGVEVLEERCQRTRWRRRLHQVGGPEAGIPCNAARSWCPVPVPVVVLHRCRYPSARAEEHGSWICETEGSKVWGSSDRAAAELDRGSCPCWRCSGLAGEGGQGRLTRRPGRTCVGEEGRIGDVREGLGRRARVLPTLG